MTKTEDKGEWCFLVENADSARDPVEVVYRLVRISGNKILERDGYITGCEHGLWGKIKEAVKNPFFVEEIKRKSTIKRIK